MEMGSGSLPESAGSSTDSLHALKFGKKIYFQDASAVGGGGGTTMETPPPPPPPMSGLRRQSRVVHGGQPPRCQVEGCRVDLSDAKAYYSKHKVCGTHSKSPKVIVAGLEQRFCQQCSRFHQLPEFDQEKRSCRRRLAGHNARRRKPSPGSLFPSSYTRLFSSVIDDYDAESSGRGGSFTIDFTAYPRLPRGDVWPTPRRLDHVPLNRNTTPWQNNSMNPTDDIFLQDSLVGTGFSGTAISPGECFPGVRDSSCALSLLSNQSWGSETRAPSLEVNDMMNAEGSLSLAQPPIGPTPQDIVVNPYSHASWGLTRTSEAVNIQHFSRLELPQQNGRQCIELEQQSRSYDTSTPDIHWSL